MNDNQRSSRLRRGQGPFGRQKADQIAELSDTALRAVTKPETLTMGEIQEVGWAFLVMARQMADGVSKSH